MDVVQHEEENLVWRKRPMNARCRSRHCHCWRKFILRAGHTAPPMTQSLRISLALLPVAFELAPRLTSRRHTRLPACGPEAASSLQNLTHMPILSLLAGWWATTSLWNLPSPSPPLESATSVSVPPLWYKETLSMDTLLPSLVCVSCSPHRP